MKNTLIPASLMGNQIEHLVTLLPQAEQDKLKGNGVASGAFKTTLNINSDGDITLVDAELMDATIEESMALAGKLIERNGDNITIVAHYMTSSLMETLLLIKISSYREDISDTFYADYAVRSDYLPHTRDDLEWRNGTAIAQVDIKTNEVIGATWDASIDEDDLGRVIEQDNPDVVHVTCMAANGGYCFTGVIA